MTTELTCADCGATVHPLEAFPESRCLSCHAKATEHDPMPTAEDIVRMWGGGR